MGSYQNVQLKKRFENKNLIVSINMDLSHLLLSTLTLTFVLSFGHRAVSTVPAATMFWKFDLHTTSHIDQLLDREDVTLRELMEEDDVLQECKAQNRRLLLFLSQDYCMQELVSLITTEPPADLEERSRFK